MRPTSYKPFWYLLALLFFFIYKTAYTQVKKPNLSTDSLKSAGLQNQFANGTDQFERLEKAIGRKQALQVTWRQLLLLKQQAIKSHDDIMLARSLYELMKINDLRTEDTLYFKNSAFMDTLINAPSASPMLKAIMYVLQAQRINNFNHIRLKFNAAAYRIKNIPVDYAAFTDSQRNSIWANDLNAALKYHAAAGDVNKLLWLSVNPDVFLFKPQFEDIVLSEYVNQAAIENSYNFNMGSNANPWPSLPSTQFRKKLDSIANSDNGTNVLKGYQQWLSFNKTNDTVAAFIESLARKYIFSFTSLDSLGHQSYITYLLAQTTSPYPVVKAHSVYQLCLLWNEDGDKYINSNFGYPYLHGSHFDKRYQYLPDSALLLFKKNKELISLYPAFNNILTLMAGHIQASGLTVTIDNKLIPSQDIPIKAFYKNVDTLYYRVVSINAHELTNHITVGTADGLMDKTPVLAGLFALPLPPDHNKHAVFLKLPPLKPGDYCLLFGYSQLQADTTLIYSIPFQVTSIAAINSDERIYVLDRKTGMPLAGATIQAFNKKTSVTLKLPHIVNKAGYITMPDDVADSISIVYKGDTLAYNLTVYKNDAYNDENIYDKDQYDGLDDFYDDKLTMNVFTDRSIYRPGQKVDYKVVLLTRNPQTGAPILFDQQNLGGGIFRGRINKWLKKHHPVITIIDPFNHQVDSIALIPNEFGSFAGSFILPKTAATGDWRISGTPEKDDDNTGDFKVEEYKRPTMELSMEKQKKMLQPGQPFAIKLKLRSFNGGDLGKIDIDYTIERSGDLPWAKSINSENRYIHTTLIDTDGYTNEKGELIIPVNDTLLAKYKWGDNDKDTYNYTISATATDATGELSEINENIDISSRPITIRISVGKIYDRQALPALTVNTIANFGGQIGRKVAVKLYAVSEPDLTGSSLKYTDQWYYPEPEWDKWFPNFVQPGPSAPKRVLVMDTIINTALYQKLVLPKEKLTTGFYELTAECRDDDHTLIGKSDYNFKIFDSGTGTIAGDNLDYMTVNAAKPGDTVSWYSSNQKNTYTIYQVLYEAGKTKVIKNIYNHVTEQSGLCRWDYRVPADAAGNLVFTRIYISDNEIVKTGKTVYLYKAVSEQPEIIIEKYRRVMEPGAQETFTLSVKTKNENAAAELMTTLYDATLDKLNDHKWTLPNQPQYHIDPSNNWPYSLSSQKNAGNFVEYNDDNGTDIDVALQGSAAGVSITSASGLQEVQVVSIGYGSTKRADLTASISSISGRQIGSISDYRQPLIILDGEVYSGDLKKIATSTITQAMILKGADAEAIYGPRAAQGVLIISTKGLIVLPVAPEPEPVVKVRKNFSETAFFFPQVHAGADGYYSFSFTMPESTTEWNWKVLAYTQKAQFAYIERKLQTQLNFMVQPNMPRLLYQGDKLKLQSRITNLDTMNVSGNITCKIEDALTGEDITSILVANHKQAFSLNKKSSGAAFFLLNVPAEQLNPLKIVITASTAGAADAEEHIIPVLSTKILVRQSLPVKFDKQPALTISAAKLPADAQMYGIGISIAQKPQAALINALPWLANYSFDCAEQTFNKLNALTIALGLMQTDAPTQKMFAAASRNMEKVKPADSPLPDEMAAESMPWLNLGSEAATGQKQLFNLLDTLTTKTNIDKHLERLYKLQQPDGGLSWFDGGNSNAYISAYVLAGFGHLKQQSWGLGSYAHSRWRDFIQKLYMYNEGQVLKATVINYDPYEVYAASYWLSGQPPSKALTGHIDSLLSASWQNADEDQLQEQALLVINTFRCTAKGSYLYQKAQQQLENIRQLAIQDKQNGLRWKDIADSEELNTSSEETMALLAEAFELSGKYPEINPGLVNWLLTTRQDQHWQTTKATSAAIDMLQKEKGSAVGENKSFSAKISGQQLSVSDDLLSGAPSAFAAVKQSPATITLQQQGHNASGALTWYYFAKPASLDTLNKAVHIGKQFYSYDKNIGWIPFTSNTQLKTGDKVRVKLTIETASRLKFVHISDPRAAAFEPADNNSGYKYSDNLGYYQSVKDTGLELFTESVPRGISEISYELIVAMDGQFTSGPARLQCMYQPAIAAYSVAQTIQVDK